MKSFNSSAVPAENESFFAAVRENGVLFIGKNIFVEIKVMRACIAGKIGSFSGCLIYNGSVCEVIISYAFISVGDPSSLWELIKLGIEIFFGKG